MVNSTDCESPDNTDASMDVINSLPQQQALVDLMHRTGYHIFQQNGQRHYGGPPPGWKGPTPGKGAVETNPFL